MNSAPDLNFEPKPARRWPGVLFSLIVPGFGLIRAGKGLRAILWFVALQLAGVVVAIVIALPVFPISVGIALFALALIAVIWMLRDSYRPGRMTGMRWLIFGIVVVALFLVPTPTSFLARAFRIPTNDMAPVLQSGDLVFVDRLSYRFSSPKRGDIIVFGTSDISALRDLTQLRGEVNFAKRLVGLPGERITIKDGAVYANDVKQGPDSGLPPITYADLPNASPTEREEVSYLVGDNEYFVLGDNSPRSFDSRSWGCVPASSVWGKVTKTYYPFSRLGSPK